MAASANTARQSHMGIVAAVPTLAVVMSVSIAVAVTNGAAVQQEAAATAEARAPAAVEASLGLDRPARRLIQQGLRNEGFDPGAPDGLFGPRTRAAIRRWQEARTIPSTGYLDNSAAQLLREAAAPPAPSSSPTTVSGTNSNESPAVTTQPRSSAPAVDDPLASEVTVGRHQATSPAGERQPAAQAAGTARLPPEILVDRHLVRAERLLADDDPAAALEAMNEVLALQGEHDLVLQVDFNFQHAQVAYAAGRTDTAIASLNQYLIAAGRGGEFYREALELPDSAEVTLREEERAARWPPGRAFRDCEVCPEMVVLPGGRLALGRYELTVGEYRAFAAATGGGAGGGCQASLWVTLDSWRDPGHPQTDRHPVTCLGWHDAQEYLSWLSRETGASYRLPTEAEWGPAAAGSRPGCYHDRTDIVGTRRVGSYGRNPAGLSDMVSNVSEWTSDCWQGDCRRRVVRGQGWGSSESFQTSASRYDGRADVRWVFRGFRLARVLD